MDGFDARYRRIQEGDLQEASELLHELPAGTPKAVRVSTLASLARHGYVPPHAPKTADVETLALRARKSIIKLDRAELDDCIRQLRAHEKGSEEYALWSSFREALFGDKGLGPYRGAELYQAARRNGRATFAIDAITLEAVSALVEQRYDEALVKARQAARMAQSEHLWLPHYFASLFLARLRRLTGTCHASVRIVDAALHAMPPLWHGWLHWERLCAAGSMQNTTFLSSASPSPIARGAQTLAHWLDPQTTFALPDGFGVDVMTSHIHRRDIEAASAVFGNELLPESPHNAWVFGSDMRMPPHMQGFVALGLGEASGALVLAGPDSSTRRIAQIALPAAVVVLGNSPKQPTRVHMLLSALALAGAQGLSRDELFEQTYGFPYNEAAHDAAFRVVRHHASNHLAHHGELSHMGKRHFLKPLVTFAVSDPRTVRPFRDMMLQMLARHGGQSARAVASDLGVPLRTVQAALKEMVGEGMCSAERSGNKVTYEVEDTTFAPLTMV